MARKAITKKTKKTTRKQPPVSESRKPLPTDPMEPKKKAAKKVDLLEEQEMKAEAWDRITALRQEVARLAIVEARTKAEHNKAKSDLDAKMTALIDEIDKFNRKLPLFDQEPEKKETTTKDTKKKKKALRGGLDHPVVKEVTGQGEAKAKKKKAKGLW